VTTNAAYDATDGSNAFLQRQVWIRFAAKIDSTLRHPESVEIATGLAI